MTHREGLTPDFEERVFSDDYADLLITYSGDPAVFEQFQDASIHIINFFFAVVHVPVSQITEDIVSVLGYSVMPSLFGVISQASLEASGVRRIRNIPSFNLRGQGVLIGFLDTGIDYTNPIFQYADGTTRIAALWDQTIRTGDAPAVPGFGSEYSREQINEALRSANPYDIVPSRDENGHGTLIAGIAAGNEVPQSDFYGIATEAELLVVKLKPAKPYLKRFFRIPEDALCFQENDIIHGLDYLVNKAADLQRPLIVCIAIGTSQGAHDGRGSLSSYLSLLAERFGVAVVVAAGNEGSARRHYRGQVDPITGYDTVELNVGENEQGFSMELWADPPNIFTIDILSPSGEYISRLGTTLDETREISFIFERTIIWVDYQMVESQSDDQLILIRFSDPAPGIWRFRVYGIRGEGPQGFHIWLPMSGFISDNTYFIRSDPYTTILSLGNTRVPVTVTAYNDLDDSLYLNASRGYTRIGVIKPDVAAPGVNVIGPTLDQGFAAATGTSVSAAHTAGIAALLMEWGVVRGNYPNMSSVEMRVFFIRGARRNQALTYPNRDWGYGILDVFNAFDTIRIGQP
jgi:subtilisin family serine protease